MPNTPAVALTNDGIRGKRSSRRELVRDALRTEIDGTEQINGVKACISMANGAYLSGDKDAVPAIVAKMRGHELLLRKVLPDVRSVELSTNTEDGPVLILDMTGEQPYEPPPGVEIVDGDFVDVEPTSNAESSNHSLYE